MSDGLIGVIHHLENQKAAIDKALAALREIEGGNGVGVSPVKESVPVTRKGGMTPEGRLRLIAALKKRWAAKRATKQAPAAPAKATPAAGHISEEGRRRLAEAMKKRWAVKRAGSAVKKATRKRGA